MRTVFIQFADIDMGWVATAYLNYGGVPYLTSRSFEYEKALRKSALMRMILTRDLPLRNPDYKLLEACFSSEFADLMLTEVNDDILTEMLLLASPREKLMHTPSKESSS